MNRYQRRLTIIKVELEELIDDCSHLSDEISLREILRQLDEIQLHG